MKKIFKYVCLVGYILAVIVLIAESSYNGDKSASHSNAVGGVIANNLNELKGDTSKVINPTEVRINNKIADAYLNDTYKLEVETIPSNATYQSLTYTSSDSSVVSVNKNGVLKFKSLGTATITVRNSEFEDILDSFEVTVGHRALEKMEMYLIHDGEEIEPINGVYDLILGEKYALKFDFEPSNATNTDISYEIISAYPVDCLRISDDEIIPIAAYEHSIGIHFTVGELYKTINVRVLAEKTVELEAIEINYDKEVYVGQVFTPIVKLIPEDTTQKDYQITVSDTEMLVLLEGGKLKARKAGKVKVSVHSKDKSGIEAEIEIEVLETPKITDFDTLYDIQMYQSDKREIIINSFTPNNLVKEFELTTDSDIVNITGNYIYASKPGVAVLKVKCDDIVKDVNITILEKPDTNIKDIVINDYNNILYKDVEYDLSKLITLNNIVLDDNTLLYEDLDISFINPTIGTITDNKFISNVSGQLHIDVVHNKSKIVKTIYLNIIDKDELLINNEEIINKLSVNVFDEIVLKLDRNKYSFNISNSNLSVSKSKDKYKLKAKEEGTTLITLTPIYNNKLRKEFNILININISHVYTEKLELKTYNNNELITNNDIVVNLNDKLKLKPILSQGTTTSLIEYSSSDNDVLKIDSRGNVRLRETGNATITIFERITNKEIKINVSVINYYKLSENKIKISGKDFTYDNENDTYKLINGSSGKIRLNFEANSTYTTVVYSSSDKGVLTVGSDGVISPKSVGKAYVTIVCDDGISGKIEEKVLVEVVEKPYISDMGNFFYFIRKSVGHFGAFLVLGILSTFSYMLFIKPGKWWLAVIVNLSQGVAIAFITEYIQTFVPGRYGALSDVMIDSSGFLSSAVSLTIILITVHLIKRKLNK